MTCKRFVHITISDHMLKVPCDVEMDAAYEEYQKQFYGLHPSIEKPSFPDWLIHIKGAQAIRMERWPK